MSFDPKTVTLENSNLIEASAGTGKTYSIAIMALRLLLEKDLSIPQILMVTFTKAAVAELELRVRAFVRLGLKVARAETIDDPTIKEVVEKAMAQHGQQKIEEKLYQSVLFLDETSVLTIHSFCQQVLKEFSFETNQIFGAEAISPDEFNQRIEDSLNEYWRKNITTLDPELLTIMLQHDFSRENLFKLVKEGVEGKKPVVPGGLPRNFLSPAIQQKIIQQNQATAIQKIDLKNKILSCLEEWQDDLPKMIANGKHHAIKALGGLTAREDRAELFSAIVSKYDKQYIEKCFGADFAQDVITYAELFKASSTDVIELIARIGVHAFDVVSQEIRIAKEAMGHITFDDMILSVSNALHIPANRDRLIHSLNEKYKAVFIDEFQDTDKDQYFIFHTLFGRDTPLFYIGDPKQSIYGWRKADIATYFKAKSEVSIEHSMNVNHRSTAGFIRAMNQFFLPVPDFDTFYYAQAPNAIRYIPVASPDPNQKGLLLQRGEEPKALRLSSCKNKDEVKQGFKNLMHHLLRSTEYSILKKGKTEALSASDIGILVRTNNEAKEIKNILASLGIPSVTINDTKLFSSEEAKELYYILMAVLDTSKNNINRALLTRIGGYTPETFARVNKEAITERFKTYQETWKKDGVYVMLRQFLSDHQFSEKFYDDNIANPERFVANVLQLVEVIHKVAERKNYDPLDQVQWFKKGLDGETREGDEYQQRLEQDEDSVKIVTIHKSKGLEYNVVIAPFLDLKNSLTDNKKSFSYRIPETGEYVVVNTALATPNEISDYEMQTEQENRRLLYVAITRARYQCYVLTSTHSDSTAQTFYRPIVEAKKADPNALPDIELWDIPPIQGVMRQRKETSGEREYAIAEKFELKEKYWRKASFTALSPEHQTTPLPKFEGASANEYDRFIFGELKKGAQTGNLLHYIFEHVNFAEPAYWPNIIEKAIKRLSSNSKPSFAEQLKQFLHQILDTKLPVGDGFCLNEVKTQDRLNELEFDFPLDKINMRSIEALSTPEAPLLVRSNDEMEGIMTGKIDLFFRHKGKFYILDWKSNYLGETAEEYNREKMQEAMTENNYHLQYHIYSVAAHKYLLNRLPDWDYDQGFGGVIYLFVRGMRNGSDTGIYLARPEKAHIERLSLLLSGQ